VGAGPYMAPHNTPRREMDRDIFVSDIEEDGAVARALAN
jgi:hypothetical protein